VYPQNQAGLFVVMKLLSLSERCSVFNNSPCVHQRIMHLVPNTEPFTEKSTHYFGVVS
jgi:hypothetical protein